MLMDIFLFFFFFFKATADFTTIVTGLSLSYEIVYLGRFWQLQLDPLRKEIQNIQKIWVDE